MNMTKDVMSVIRNTTPAENGTKTIGSRLLGGTVGAPNRPANANLSAGGILGDQMRNQVLKMSLLGACLASCVVSGVSAQVVFEDNFDSENGGIGVLDYMGLSQWSLVDGTVDLIGNGFGDLLPGNGLYLDLDGSSNNAVTMHSSSISLAPGDYLLEFDLAGNQRTPPGDSMNLKFGSFIDEDITLADGAAFTSMSWSFHVALATSEEIWIDHAGSDNVGLLLDNVRLSVVPAPSSLALVAALGLITSRRRRCGIHT